MLSGLQMSLLELCFICRNDHVRLGERGLVDFRPFDGFVPANTSRAFRAKRGEAGSFFVFLSSQNVINKKDSPDFSVVV